MNTLPRMQKVGENPSFFPMQPHDALTRYLRKENEGDDLACVENYVCD